MLLAKQVIKWLSRMFNAVWYINIVLSGSAIVFQVINFMLKKKVLMASFLGLFKVKLERFGSVSILNNDYSVFVDDFLVNPTLLLAAPWGQFFIFFYSLLIITVVLFFNYQFKLLFSEMNQSILDSELFKMQSIKRFQLMSVFSMGVFVLGVLASLVKVFVIKTIKMGDFNLIPVFDHTVFNMFWFSVALYLVSIIFKVGLGLKEENELTI